MDSNNCFKSNKLNLMKVWTVFCCFFFILVLSHTRIGTWVYFWLCSLVMLAIEPSPACKACTLAIKQSFFFLDTPPSNWTILSPLVLGSFKKYLVVWLQALFYFFSVYLFLDHIKLCSGLTPVLCSRTTLAVLTELYAMPENEPR